MKEVNEAKASDVVDKILRA